MTTTPDWSPAAIAGLEASGTGMWILTGPEDNQVVWAEFDTSDSAWITRASDAPVDLTAAITQPWGPAGLEDLECRRVLAAIAEGASIHAAIRAAYAGRRQVLESVARTGDGDSWELLTQHARFLPRSQRQAAYLALCKAVLADDRPAIEAALDLLTGVPG